MNNKQKYDWPVLIARQVESGDGVAKFCRANNLHLFKTLQNLDKQPDLTTLMPWNVQLDYTSG